MKTTAICRFDGTSLLLLPSDNNIPCRHEFQSWEELKSVCANMNQKVEIEHWHPASGLRVNHG
jgi:hypothetical protein